MSPPPLKLQPTPAAITGHHQDSVAGSAGNGRHGLRRDRARRDHLCGWTILLIMMVVKFIPIIVCKSSVSWLGRWPASPLEAPDVVKLLPFKPIKIKWWWLLEQPGGGHPTSRQHLLCRSRQRGCYRRPHPRHRVVPSLFSAIVPSLSSSWCYVKWWSVKCKGCKTRGRGRPWFSCTSASGKT